MADDFNQLFDADAVEAGPETDWRLLHHALDWLPGIAAFGQAAYTAPAVAGRCDEPVLWPVSSDWRAAQNAKTALAARGVHVSVEPVVAGGFAARLTAAHGALQAHAPTPALALTRVVLKGVLTGLVAKR